MNELKDHATTTTKKNKGKLQLIHQGVNTKNYNQGTVLHLCTTTTAAASCNNNNKNLSDLLTRDSQYYTDFHLDTGKKLLLKGDTYIETVREGQKYFTNITSYRKI